MDDGASSEEEEQGTMVANTEGAPNASEAPIVLQRLTAAVAFLQAEGHQEITLIGLGTSALQSALYLAKEASQTQIKALIIVDAISEDAGKAATLNSALKDLHIPTLDIFFASDIHAERQAKQRQQAVKGLNKDYYQQLRLPARTTQQGSSSSQLAKRVRGWLASK